MNPKILEAACEKNANEFAACQVERTSHELRQAVRDLRGTVLKVASPIRLFRRHPVWTSIAAGTTVAGGALVAAYAFRKAKTPRPPDVHLHVGKAKSKGKGLATQLGSLLLSAVVAQVTQSLEENRAIRQSTSCNNGRSIDRPTA